MADECLHRFQQETCSATIHSYTIDIMHEYHRNEDEFISGFMLSLHIAIDEYKPQPTSRLQF